MMFYQQSAVVGKALTFADSGVLRCETAIGAVITQLLTAAILFAVAIGVRSGDVAMPRTIGDISAVMVPLLGTHMGPLIFSVGVLGASMVAAIVCSLTMAWGVGELCGMRRSLEHGSKRSAWFSFAYPVGVIAAAMLVIASPDPLWLNIVAQVSNVFLLPLMFILVIVLAVTCLPDRVRPRGWYLGVVVVLATVTSGCGVFGAVQVLSS